MPNKKKQRNKCLNCLTEVKRAVDKYCDNECQLEYEQKIWVDKWLRGEVDGVVKYGQTSARIKRHLIETRGNKCEECGWDKTNPYTGNVPIELEHVDGNHTNNKIENLKLLCPNCHSLTATYKALNTGSGREFRRKNKPL